jgi:hypothetical protein
MPVATSFSVPPRNVENRILLPAGLSFATNPSRPPASCGWAALTAGKLVLFEDVQPDSHALPSRATAMLVTASVLMPPRKVEYTRDAPAETNGFIFATKPSWRNSFLQPLGPH